MIEHQPEIVRLKFFQVGNDGDEDVLDALAMQRERQMMMVDDIVALLRPQDHRDHVIAEEATDLLGAALAQALAFVLDLPHADRDLSRAQIPNGNRREDRIARKG
jgi:hypothetical protein